MSYFRFHKIFGLLPGLRLNLSKSGPSVSLGVTGARVNVGPKGVRTTVGVPGSGLSHVTQQSWAQKDDPEPTSFEPEPVSQPATVADSLAAEQSSSEAVPHEIAAEREDGPRNARLYACAERWLPVVARSRTNQRLPEWLIEAEQDYRADNIDRHAYELRRRIILEEMAARGRGVRPRPMSRREEEAFQREMMAAAAADEAASG